MHVWKQWGLAALVVGAATVPTALAADDRGPAFGSNKISTAIEDTGGEADVDAYVASLIEGETLTVSVGAAKKSSLRPALQVLDPDGVDRTPELKSKGGGKKLSFKKLVVDKSGRWTVRVSASTAAQGAYTASFKVGKAKPISLKKQTLDTGVATEVTHAIPGVDGAQATITVTFSKKGAPLSVVALTDPDGNDVPGAPGLAVDAFTLKGTRLTLKKARLANGDGDYGLTLGAESGVASYSVKASVKPLGRPKGKTKIPSTEPFLTAIGDPIRGVQGAVITLNGLNLGVTDEEQPSVFFGGAEGVVTSVAPDGLSLKVVPPEGEHGSTVAVSVVDRFGQASQRDGHFFYVPPPTMTAIVDDAGVAVASGSTAGGLTFRLLGEGFESGQSLRFGLRSAPSPTFVSETEFGVTSPATGTAGNVFLFLTDAFGRESTSPFQFEYKAPPTLSAVASATFSPAAGRESGGTVVTVTGSGFERADELLFDGAVIPSTFVSSTQRTFVSPAGSPGAYPVALRDRVGEVIDGPDFRIKSAPTLDSVEAIGGFVLPGDQLGLGGGTILRARGENLESDDTVRLGGVEATLSFATSTEIQFAAPATAPGGLDLTVTDILGDSASLNGAFTSVGFDDVSSTRVPAGTATDDYGAFDGIFGDVDGDGLADDLVLVGPTGGTRTELLRLFQGDASGNLIDITATNMPADTSDPLGAGFGGFALAIGDLDGGNGPEIVVGARTYFSGTTYYYYDGVRVLSNDGSGGFAFSSTITPAPLYYYYGGYVYADDEYANEQYIGAIAAPQPTGQINAIAIGDLDGDGDNEVVTTGSSGLPMYCYVDPSKVDFTSDTYTVSYYDAQNSYVAAFYYLSGTRILNNEGQLRDRTLQRFGVLGSILSTNPGNNGRDLALGDVDGTNGLDIVITWDDPLTASIYGSATAYYYGTSSDSERVSTRVLLNDGSGFFSDETATWLPAGSAPEFWQGHALKLVDLVGDSALDLVIVHDKGPSTTTSALRILRNDGGTTGFTDVTASVLPLLPAGENLAGSSLQIVDANGDGHDDIVIGTTRALVDGQGATSRSTRMLFGNGAGTFSLGPEFLESVATDTGEARFLAIGDLAGHADPVLVIGTENTPQTSGGSHKLRAFDWED